MPSSNKKKMTIKPYWTPSFLFHFLLVYLTKDGKQSISDAFILHPHLPPTPTLLSPLIQRLQQEGGTVAVRDLLIKSRGGSIIISNNRSSKSSCNSCSTRSCRSSSGGVRSSTKKKRQDVVIIHDEASLLDENPLSTSSSLSYNNNNNNDTEKNTLFDVMDDMIVHRVYTENIIDDIIDTTRILEGCLIQRVKKCHDSGVNGDANIVMQHEALINLNHSLLFGNKEDGDDEHEYEHERGRVQVAIDAIILQLYRYHLLLKQQHQIQDKEYDNNNNINFEFILQFTNSNHDENNYERMYKSTSISSCIPYLIPENSSTVINSSLFGIDKIAFIQHLHEYSYHQRGTEQSRVALDVLGLLSNERNPFRFNTNARNINTSNKDNNNNGKGRNVISYQPKLIPEETINEVMHTMDIIKSNQWLSTNPDSVDGLPSLHLNLVSGGQPLFDNVALMDGDDHNDSEESFEKVVSHLTSLLQPIVYDKLLPIVKEECESCTVEVSDIFLRYYGRDIKLQQSHLEEEEDIIKYDNNDDEEVYNDDNLNNGRFGLSPHYDVFSSATSVIALDSTATSGRNGLYTIYSRNKYNKNDKNMTTFVSSHAGLRQFFPLNAGDGVIHTFDILHGVDVDPDLDCSRTSLIIWFVDKHTNHNEVDNDNGAHNTAVSNENIADKHTTPRIITDQPWLLNPVENDHLKQFVLALASDCKAEVIKESQDDGTTSTKSNSNKNVIHELYIKSSKQGNAFALNSLAEICIDGLLSSKDQLNDAMSIPSMLNQYNPFISKNEELDEERVYVLLARALWYESSMRGNRVAQASLADSLMEEFMMTPPPTLQQINNNDDDDIDSHQDLFLKATTFFVMSAQQGYEVAKDALGRIIQIEYSRSKSNDDLLDEEEIMMQPVIQTALIGL